MQNSHSTSAHSAQSTLDSKLDSAFDSTNRAKKDEFSKLKILALELKNMQLRLLKDINNADYYKQNNAMKLN